MSVEHGVMASSLRGVISVPWLAIGESIAAPGIFGVLGSELARAQVALKLYLVTVDILEMK